jgi:hypothetical protein
MTDLYGLVFLTVNTFHCICRYYIIFRKNKFPAVKILSISNGFQLIQVARLKTPTSKQLGD